MEALPLSRLQSNLTCSICHGYLIDATTITECMHTFCKSCLLQRVESGRTCCPVCGVQVQRSRLGEQLRLDHAVQALVYAAVPGLWQEEQRRRKHFVDHHPLSTSVAPPLQHPTCFAPSDPISLSLDFIPQSRDEDAANLNLKGPNSPQAIGRRFFRCPAAVAIHHFQKLLSLKFELPPHYTVEIYCQNEKLASDFRLMDVAYKTGWTQEEPLRLQYKIVKNQVGKSTTLVTATGSATHHVSQPPSWRSKTSSSSMTEVVNNKRSQPTSGNSSQSTPPKQRRLSLVQTVVRDVVKTSRSSLSVEVDQPPPSVGKKRGRKKRKRRKGSTDLVPIVQPSHPLKVKIVERVKSTTTESISWKPSSRPVTNGVELLVQAAELASRQNPTPTPPPPPPPLAAPKLPPPIEMKRKSSPPPLIAIASIVVDKCGDSINNNSRCIEKLVENDDLEDDNKLMIADSEVANSQSSNGRDSGMANEEDDDDSSGALDLSSKSSRTISPPAIETMIANHKSESTRRQSVSPQLIQQRSTALHSITDSLAQRQRQRLMQQQQQQQQQQQPTAATNAERVEVTQRFIVAMHQFAAAAAAAAARPPHSPSKSLSYGLLRRPF